MKDRIRRVMESQHMTQQRFADFVHISPASLSSILTGRTRPTLPIIEAIKTNIPSISTDWLMSGKEPMYIGEQTNNSEEKEMPDTSPTPSSNNTYSESILNFDIPSAAPSYQQPAPEVRPKPQKEIYESAKVVKNIDIPQRTITEIRIFYSDQTWETFVPQK